MGRGLIFVMAGAVMLAGCFDRTLTVSEGRLSTNQRIAMVSSSGNGVSPPTNLVMYEAAPGHMVPVSTGFAQAPVTALMEGVGAAATLGAWNYGAARAIRPDRTTVSSNGGTNTNQTNQVVGDGNIQQNQAGSGNVQVAAP